MFLDTVSEDYWKELAEERRIALNESLVENEEVHQTWDSLFVFYRFIHFIKFRICKSDNSLNVLFIAIDANYIKGLRMVLSETRAAYL